MIQIINKKENVFGDDIAFVEQYDFSTANMSEENRIKAITQIASICYQNPKAVGSESLYNRLAAESKGLPSSSFEFVPILLKAETILNGITVNPYLSQCLKFGEFVENHSYLLTNLRALIADIGAEESKKFYNTEEESAIIKQHFKVFQYKVDLPTRSQMVRHRVSWQELSRRYVSGERVPFDFYVSEKMKNLYIWNNERHFSIEDFIEVSICLYKTALKNGVKPQEARRIIPQMGYTQIWGAFMPKQLDNFFKLRLDEHSQWEIQQIAQAMYSLIHTENE